jgi:hypothetical protein
MIAAEGSASLFRSNPLVTTMMLVGFALLSLSLLSLVGSRHFRRWPNGGPDKKSGA